METLSFKVIVLEGSTDEAFIIEYMNQLYGASYGQWNYNKPKYSKIINIKDGNILILITIAGSKNNLVPTSISLLRDSLSGMLPTINSIIILRDYNNLSKEDIYKSVSTSFIARYREEDVICNEYGLIVKGIPVYILPIGDLNYTHQIPEWNHELEDYLIQSIIDGSKDNLQRAYENISIDVINKAHDSGFQTYCKSPLCITMAFSDPSSIAGFYKKITAKRIDKMIEILERTGFRLIFNKFLE